MFKTAMIILNHNDTDNAARLVKSVEVCEAINKIIVADNSSDKNINVLNSLKSDKTDVIFIENNGYANGNNAAIEYLNKEYGGFDFFIISNPDIIIEPSCIISCLDFLKTHEQYAIAAPLMYSADGNPHHLTGWREKTFLCDLSCSAGLLTRLLGKTHEVYPPEHWQTPFSDADCVAGSFFVINAPIFAQIGFFDKNTFLYYEEDIIGFKLKRAGYKSAILASCRFTHLEGTAINKSSRLVKRYWMLQKSRLYFGWHYKKVNIFEYFILILATILGLIQKCIKMIMNKFKK
jgi:N-acetylglucosaminyl-diphospho-decaprenol L-rhamnosyltransferase